MKEIVIDNTVVHAKKKDYNKIIFNSYTMATGDLPDYMPRPEGCRPAGMGISGKSQVAIVKVIYTTLVCSPDR